MKLPLTSNLRKTWPHLVDHTIVWNCRVCVSYCVIIRVNVFWKELLLVTEVSTIWAEVILRVKWIVFVSLVCWKRLVSLLSHDGISWKTHVKFVISHWWVSIHLLITQNELLILLVSNHLLCRVCMSTQWMLALMKLEILAIRMLRTLECRVND